jgi:hypothetical protein
VVFNKLRDGLLVQKEEWQQQQQQQHCSVAGGRRVSLVHNSVCAICQSSRLKCSVVKE